MKLALLGAAGAMAEVVRRDLHEFAPTAEVTIADLREVAAKYPNERPATVDLGVAHRLFTPVAIVTARRGRKAGRARPAGSPGGRTG